MPSTDPTDEPTGRSRDELLDRVVRRGRQLRQRRQAGRAIGAVALVAIVAVGASQLAPEEDDQQVTAASTTSTTDDEPPGERSTTTRADAGTSTTTTDPAVTTVPTPTTSGTATSSPTTSTTTAAPTTTTASSCRNSMDEACGPTYWDPPPGPNQPLTVEVSFTPAQPQPGDEVTFQVTVIDPDARIDQECNRRVTYGDGNDPNRCVSSASCAARHGPWTPPEPTPDRYETTFTHTYEGTGDFTAVFAFESRSACYDDPYGSSGERQVTVPIRSSS